MKNDYISARSKSIHIQQAHIERSLAFHKAMSKMVNSVKFSFTQPKITDRLSNNENRRALNIGRGGECFA